MSDLDADMKQYVGDGEEPTVGKSEELDKLRKENESLKKQLEESHVCPRCGRPDTAKPLSVKEDILKEYFRCMLGQIPFRHTINCFDGRFLITFTELSGDAINNQLKKAPDDADYLDYVEAAMLVATLSKVVIHDTDSGEDTVLYSATDEELANNIKNPTEAKERIVKVLGQVKLSVVRAASTAFTVLMTALVDKAQDQNFFEGAGLL